MIIGIASNTQRPKNIVNIGRIYIIINNDDPFCIIIGGWTLRSKGENLARVVISPRFNGVQQ